MRTFRKDKKEWPENLIDAIYIPSAWAFLTETTMPVSRAMMVNPCATILPLIIFCKNKYLLNYDHVLNATWLPSLSFLPNLKRPFTRKKVVAPQPKEWLQYPLQSCAFMIPPIGRKGFSLNFLTSFSEGASWCFFPVSLFTASSLFNCKVMERSEEKALALEVPVSTQIHPLQCSLCF